MNAGAIRYGKEYLLLLRVEDRRRKTRLHLARSSDGLHFTIEADPIQYPYSEFELRHGTHRFDPRITALDGRFYICHALWLEKHGCCLAMAETEDFHTFRAIGRPGLPSNRNGALFPEKINGRYCRMERPQTTGEYGGIWITFSPDLIHWGDARLVEMPDTKWGEVKIGAGTVPIKTAHGWLIIYHGVAATCSSNNYHLGAALLDLEDPSRVVAAPETFILAAERSYECIGQTPNVVFIGGACETDDGYLHLYYGGADTCMNLARTSVDDLVQFCLNEP